MHKTRSKLLDLFQEMIVLLWFLIWTISCLLEMSS
jgi:hypothetical protein